MDGMSDDLEQRFEYLLKRLRTSYESIGLSSGRPYIYFVYKPSQERHIQKLAQDWLQNGSGLIFHPLDILPLTIDSLKGQEELRQRLLNDPLRTESAAEAIMRLWTRKTSSAICITLEHTADGERPVVVLRNLAALYPLGNPTSLMEFVAEQEPRHPKTGAVVPIVLLIPGFRPPHTSRVYYFLDQEHLQLKFYRGEEI